MKELILKNKTMSIVIGLLIVILIIWLFSGSSGKSDGSAKSLAKCLKDKGAKFYGASWCPHCKDQKAAFGSDAADLPYIECSNPDRTQTKQCTDAGVKGYPTWKFANGQTRSGAMTLQQLKDASGC